MGNFGAPDGAVPSDILWQNTDGQASIWEMNGTNVVGGGLLSGAGGVAINPGATWKAVGTGHFSDGVQSDILWQNTDGQASIWDMTGNTVTGGGLTADAGGVAINPGADWKAVGSGDFSDSGHPGDILWQNTNTGQVSVWNMGGSNGATVTGGGLIGANPGTDWKAIGTGDFNDSGHPGDILFQNSATSQVAIWDMGGPNGTSIIGGGVVATPGLDWKAIGSGDLGDSAILLQNTTSGQTATWDMGGAEGTTIVGGGMTSLNAGPNLKAVALTTGPAFTAIHLGA